MDIPPQDKTKTIFYSETGESAKSDDAAKKITVKYVVDTSGKKYNPKRNETKRNEPKLHPASAFPSNHCVLWIILGRSFVVGKKFNIIEKTTEIDNGAVWVHLRNADRKHFGGDGKTTSFPL